jgi:periplasmic protein TonB
VKTRPFSFPQTLPPDFVWSPYQQNKNFPREDIMVEQATLQRAMLGQTMFEQSMLEQAMFGDSLLEVSWSQRLRRGGTTLTSFGLQAVIIGLLLLIPLLRTVRLPIAQAVSTPISAGRPNVEPLEPTPVGDDGSSAPTASPAIEFRRPSYMPRYRDGGQAGSYGPTTGGLPFCVGCTGDPGIPEGLRGMFSGGTRPLPAQPPSAPATRVFRTSSMLQGALIHSVQPVYPPLAKMARIQGSVELAAIIGKDGSIENLRTLSGPPMLVAAAVNAVRQWRYRPYILNNEAIEVETRITVNFTLSEN